MPVYEYECQSCKYKTEKLRKMGERDSPLECGECGGKQIRIMSKPSDPQFVGRGWTPKFYDKSHKK